MRIVNLTRDIVVAENVQVANSFCLRFFGLMGRKRLDPYDGLLLTPCQCIHTFFMRFAIDVVHLDVQWRVVSVFEALPPFRCGAVIRETRHIIELAASTVAKSNLCVGDTLSPADFIPTT